MRTFRLLRNAAAADSADVALLYGVMFSIFAEIGMVIKTKMSSIQSF